jgi:hypothetical protein
MGALAEYRQHAKVCRELAVKMIRPGDKEIFESLAKAWEKVAAFRERDFCDDDFS